MGYQVQGVRRGRATRQRGNNGCCCGCLFSSCLGLFGLFGGILTVIVLALLWWDSNEPKPPTPNFTPSAAEAQSFENKIEQASNNAVASGNFNVNVTEGEASSWLNLRAPSITNSSLPLENMQVIFRNGNAAVYGEMDTDVARVGTLIDFDLNVTPDGKLDVSISNIDAGGVSVPSGVRDELNAQIKSIIDTELRKVGNTPDYTITTLQITDGSLLIQGTTP